MGLNQRSLFAAESADASHEIIVTKHILVEFWLKYPIRKRKLDANPNPTAIPAKIDVQDITASTSRTNALYSDGYFGNIRSYINRIVLLLRFKGAHEIRKWSCSVRFKL